MPADRPSRAAPLPLAHPDFRYIASRNPYASCARKLVFPDGLRPARVNEEAESLRGAWRNEFGMATSGDSRSSSEAIRGADRQAKGPRQSATRARIHVELGCNAGHTLLARAERDPMALFVGIEWKYKQVARGAEKAIARGIRNAVLVRGNYERLPFLFAPGEIDELWMYFPDPWPKRAHWKNRFFTAERLDILETLVAPNGQFEIRTDHEGYFEWMLREAGKRAGRWRVLRSGTKAAPVEAGFHETTLFEGVFRREGKPVHELLLAPESRIGTPC